MLDSNDLLAIEGLIGKVMDPKIQGLYAHVTDTVQHCPGNQEHHDELGKIKDKMAETRGGWKVIAAIAGAVGAVIASILATVISALVSQPHK